MLTIFTPTYNRAYILGKLYESLCAQSCHDFEWVIVDDGSVDNTQDLVASWITECRVEIHYFKQENQGKHIAINRGLDMAHGELFFIVDSDDLLKKNAVETVLLFWKQECPNAEISGIIGYREFFDGRIVGNPLPSDVKRCKLRNTGNLYGSSGDKVVIYRTDVMRRFPFPKFGHERFLGENYMFDQIDDEYDMLVMNERIYRFGYQEDGLSQDFRKLYRNNPLGFLASYQRGLKYRTTFKAKVRTTAHIINLCLYAGAGKIFVKHLFTIRGVLAFGPALYLYYKIFIKKVSDVKPFECSSEQ
jgi:glycosyltransferase involved in cell wall biosynthesis